MSAATTNEREKTGMKEQVTYSDVLRECERLDLAVEVWPTGGGCHNFCYADDDIHVLLGEVGLHDESFELGICPSVAHESDDWGRCWEYDHELDGRSEEQFPYSEYPDNGDAVAVASWMAAVVGWFRDQVTKLDADGGN